jgi:hypothetical protein
MYEGVYVFKLAVTDHLGAQGIDYVTVTVKAATTTSLRMETDDEEMSTGELANASDGLKHNAVLGRKTFEELTECTVVIFNDIGEKIYAGKWSTDTDHEILKPGMYIYNVIKGGIRIDSGKIVKRSI